MDTSFLPSFPLALSYPLLFGALLVAGTVGGEMARVARLPRIVGYVLVGFLVGPLLAALGLQPLVERARVFVDLALGLA
ncbi:MAG TPA: sodium:proton exchanger, partial [Usitatibacter sp.]|nr:sodium:proton exchanger [Usitatibacter sp.]